MSFHDWLVESRQRYRTHPPWTATRRSARAFINGAFRPLGRYIGHPIWHHTNWDVLVVLDACRYDLWNEVAPEYDLATNREVWSNASCSIDWINRNFNAYPQHARRTGYVTANPFADHSTTSARSADLRDGPLAYFKPLYQSHWSELYDGQIATVVPEDVTDHAIAAWRDRDQQDMERLVVHYMQPHEPYRSRPEWGSGDNKLLENLVDSDTPAGSSIWPQLEAGNISRSEFWQVYKDNLRWVLDDVTERLLPNLDGRVVVTADHGNAVGEWGEWHHPPGALGPAVRKVPWVDVDCTDEQTVQPDVQLDATAKDVNVDTEARLEALGYR